MMPNRLQLPLAIAITACVSFWAGRNSAPRSSPVAEDSLKSPALAGKGLRAPISLAVPKDSGPPRAGEKSASTTDASAPTESSWFAKFLQEGVPKLTVAQLDSYLRENGRSAESLITASRITGDLSLLREAVSRFPNDPKARHELAMKTTDPAEKLASLKAFAVADPSNGLGSYLAAHAAYTSGDTAEAVRLLTEAATRTNLNSYMMEKVQATEEAYVSAGIDPLKAKAAAITGLGLPEMTDLRDLSKDMADLRERYVQSGDAASAAAISEMTMALGRKLQVSGDGTALSELVGQGIEKQALKQLDPQTPVDEIGQTAAQRLEELAARKDFIAKTVQGVDPSASAVSPQILSQYLDRLKALGELSATQWLRSRLGSSQQ